jgi:hypothetical protein
MEAGKSRIMVSVSGWQRRMHSAQGWPAYVEGTGERRTAGARKLRWGSTKGLERESFWGSSFPS